jgi:hypothetical protein
MIYGIYLFLSQKTPCNRSSVPLGTTYNRQLAELYACTHTHMRMYFYGGTYISFAPTGPFYINENSFFIYEMISRFHPRVTAGKRNILIGRPRPVKTSGAREL